MVYPLLSCLVEWTTAHKLEKRKEEGGKGSELLGRVQPFEWRGRLPTPHPRTLLPQSCVAAVGEVKESNNKGSFSTFVSLFFSQFYPRSVYRLQKVPMSIVFGALISKRNGKPYLQCGHTRLPTPVNRLGISKFCRVGLNELKINPTSSFSFSSSRETCSVPDGGFCPSPVVF